MDGLCRLCCCVAVGGPFADGLPSVFQRSLSLLVRWGDAWGCGGGREAVWASSGRGQLQQACGFPAVKSFCRNVHCELPQYIVSLGSGLQPWAALVIVCLAVVTLPPRSTAPAVSGCRLVGCSVVNGLPLRSRAVAGVSQHVYVCLGPVLGLPCPVSASYSARRKQKHLRPPPPEDGRRDSRQGDTRGRGTRGRGRRGRCQDCRRVPGRGHTCGHTLGRGGGWRRGGARASWDDKNRQGDAGIRFTRRKGTGQGARKARGEDGPAAASGAGCRGRRKEGHGRCACLDRWMLPKYARGRACPWCPRVLGLC